jgi:hypothetical protein
MSLYMYMCTLHDEMVHHALAHTQQQCDSCYAGVAVSAALLVPSLVMCAAVRVLYTLLHCTRSTTGNLTNTTTATVLLPTTALPCLMLPLSGSIKTLLLFHS